ncbi:MAG: transcriptional regulator, TetR family [Rhodobacteraceae bacterium HLUCCA24]|nr:MAG: transcriptional regulator, TetR family [Rhodobacteraceae bacterium HLUCCA24]
MPRVRAADYDEKVQQICDEAARLFATSGYPAARMAEIADACGVSKSMLYHYFPTKDDVLFYMIRDHLEQVIDVLETMGTEGDLDPREALRSFVLAFLERSALARQRNVVAMNDAKYLSPEKREIIRQLERRIVALIAERLRPLNDDIPDALLTPFTFFLLGILNWTDSWYRPDGSIAPAELADHATRVFLDGFVNLRPQGA